MSCTEEDLPSSLFQIQLNRSRTFRLALTSCSLLPLKCCAIEFAHLKFPLSEEMDFAKAGY